PRPRRPRPGLRGVPPARPTHRRPPPPHGGDHHRPADLGGHGRVTGQRGGLRRLRAHLKHDPESTPLPPRELMGAARLRWARVAPWVTWPRTRRWWRRVTAGSRPR